MRVRVASAAFMPSSTRAPFRTTLLCIVTASVCVGFGWWIGAKQGIRSALGVAQPAAESHRIAALPSFAEAVERTTPGVVAVRAIVAMGKQTSTSESLSSTAADTDSKLGVRDGSGFVVHKDGLVVTARHLTVAALRLVVDVPELGPFEAEIVGEDDVTDLAALRLVDAPPLHALELGDSASLRAGDWVIAVGNPYGFRHSVTAGIVSYVGRHLPTDDQRVTSEFVQFSAAVNPGSSGCPIVDLHGRVMGVTTQGAEIAQGLSFAIPSRTVKWALAAMDESKDGRVHRGRLGISFAARVAGAGGCVVRRVVEGQAADEAGILVGDVVFAVNGEPVSDSADLHTRITQSAPGTVLRLRIQRGGVDLPELSVTLRDAATTTPTAQNAQRNLEVPR
jgi:serine protease Do